MFQLFKKHLQDEEISRNEDVCYNSITLEQDLVLYKIIRGIILK